MQVNVSKQIVNLNLIADSNGYSTVYSTMSPLQSPYFESASDLFLWFNSLNNNEKKSYITNRNHLVIYNHTVDTIGREKYIKGELYYTTHKNEVVSIDEAYIYDFTTNKFL